MSHISTIDVFDRDLRGLKTKLKKDDPHYTVFDFV